MQLHVADHQIAVDGPHMVVFCSAMIVAVPHMAVALASHLVVLVGPLIAKALNLRDDMVGLGCSIGEGTKCDELALK